jgi:hypothetical protein
MSMQIAKLTIVRKKNKKNFEWNGKTTRKKKRTFHKSSQPFNEATVKNRALANISASDFFSYDMIFYTLPQQP